MACSLFMRTRIRRWILKAHIIIIMYNSPPSHKTFRDLYIYTLCAYYIPIYMCCIYIPTLANDYRFRWTCSGRLISGAARLVLDLRLPAGIYNITIQYTLNRYIKNLTYRAWRLPFKDTVYKRRIQITHSICTGIARADFSAVSG